MPAIHVIGSLNIDLTTTTPRLPAAGETITATSFSTYPGGKGANQAVACARATRSSSHYLHRDQLSSPHDIDEGVRIAFESDPSATCDVTMTGAVGYDSFGILLRDTMTVNGVNVKESVSEIQGVTTGVAVIIVDETTGENRIMITPGANARVLPEAVCELPIPLPDLIVMQLEIPLETVSHIMRLAREKGVDVILNPAPAVKLADEMLKGLAHLVLNETEAAILCGYDEEEWRDDIEAYVAIAGDRLREKGVQHVVVTLGASGVAYSAPGAKWETISAIKVPEVVDTTAAGDTFVGYYAASIVEAKRASKPWNIGEAVRRANMAAAKTVTKHGAMESIPWRDELDTKVGTKKKLTSGAFKLDP